MSHRFFTIGHSTRSISEFVGLLNEAEVRLVIDVRTVPRSRTNPQYNMDTLPETLAEFQVGYEHIAALGGLRPHSRSVPSETNGFWENQSFHNYADYALSSDFHAALDQLVEQGRRRRCVLMCSEAVWWRCHRRIVADHLIARGETVFHIMGEGRLQRAELTSGAVADRGDIVVYPGP
jgi:uncharacterized protein (DUF488 family)